MTIEVLSGGICEGVRRIEKPDNIGLRITRPRCELLVHENGDTRGLTISRKVAEVLAASGLPYGD